MESLALCVRRSSCDFSIDIRNDKNNVQNHVPGHSTGAGKLIQMCTLRLWRISEWK